MAFSKKQYENFIRTIVVAAVSRELRRAKIIEKAIKRAKADGKVATGGLTRPELTGSMIPFSDDRFLVPKDSVIVNVNGVQENLPTNISVRVLIETGVDGDYVFTRSDVDAEYPKGTMPNVKAIKTWVKAKSDRGLMSFTYKGKPANLNKDYVLHSVAYGVARGIMENSISERHKSDYFRPVKGDVEAALDRGLNRAAERILEKYEQDLYQRLEEVLDINLV